MNIGSAIGSERHFTTTVRRIQLGGIMRNAKRLELPLQPEREMIAICGAQRISRLATRIRCPRSKLGAEFHDHPPARAMRPASRRRIERSRPALNWQVERR